MPTNRETFPVEFKGGLITNISPLQQGINMPGSAITLKNFEPSIVGGYRRILGFSKFAAAKIPPYGLAVVDGASQTGTTLTIARTHTTPVAGDTFTVTGITGTYTITGLAFDAGNNRTTLTLSTSLASSPANGAALTFVTYDTAYRTQGMEVFGDDVIVALNSDIYKTSGGDVAFTKVNVPSYGTVLVNGGSQSASPLDIAVDGLTVAPQIGDMFTKYTQLQQMLVVQVGRL